MRLLVLVALCAGAGLAQLGLDRPQLASRAQSFAEQLPNLVGTETLRQRSISYASRLRIRVGEAALKPAPPKIRERTIHSELAYALRGQEEKNWYELRTVLTVDGKRVNTPRKAREKLLLGLKSDDERQRLKLMEEFSRYGLEALATDYSLTLLLFRPGEIDRLQLEEAGSEFIGADRVLRYRFRRQDDGAALTLYDQKQVVRQPLVGEIWVRQADMTPVRIRLDSRLEQNGVVIEDTGEVEYDVSRFGVAVPVRVRHTRQVNGQLVNETNYLYENFQKFGAETELKFNP